MDMGKWTLPMLVAGALPILAVRGSKRLQLGWKDQLACYAVASLAVSAIVGLDHILGCPLPQEGGVCGYRGRRIRDRDQLYLASMRKASWNWPLASASRK
jgi:hypothetical protein